MIRSPVQVLNLRRMGQHLFVETWTLFYLCCLHFLCPEEYKGKISDYTEKKKFLERGHGGKYCIKLHFIILKPTKFEFKLKLIKFNVKV